MTQTVTVVGAGIGGLTVAVGLARSGWDVTLVERDNEPRAAGAGLVLWPNALAAFDAVGVGEAVREVARPVSRMTVRRPDGARLTELPVAEVSARYGPVFAVHRPELHRVLLDAFDGRRRFGVAAEVVDGRLVVGGAEPHGNLVVGADGAGSVTRTVVAGPVRLRPTGQLAKRAVVDASGIEVAETSETWGCGARFGIVPLRDGLVYWFTALRAQEAASPLESLFAGWHEPVAALIGAPRVATAPTLPLEDLPWLRTWHDGRAVLLGDAAHAMTPNLGQGAAQAVQDAAVLVDELSRQQLPAALAAYERRRKRHAEMVVRRSRAAGRIAQAAKPTTTRLRDAVTRATPRAVAVRQMMTVLGPA